jgi:hypothetical protein
MHHSLIFTFIFTVSQLWRWQMSLLLALLLRHKLALYHVLVRSAFLVPVIAITGFGASAQGSCKGRWLWHCSLRCCMLSRRPLREGEQLVTSALLEIRVGIGQKMVGEVAVLELLKPPERYRQKKTKGLNKFPREMYQP